MISLDILLLWKWCGVLFGIGSLVGVVDYFREDWSDDAWHRKWPKACWIILAIWVVSFVFRGVFHA